MMDLAGISINKRYRLLDKIFSESSGDIYSGFDDHENIPVAVKILDRTLVFKAGFDYIRFGKDMSALSGITHENIAQVLDYGMFENPRFPQGLFIVMEPLQGRLLEQIISAESLPGLETAVSIIDRICAALEITHDHGVIHGYINPGNIMITDTYGEVKLCNFALGELKGSTDQQITKGIVFMAPEQSGIIQGMADERSDLYALGVLFFLVLTGNVPFEGDSLVPLLHKQSAKRPDPPSRRVADIPPAIDAMVLRLLEKDPANRYQSAAGFRADLKRFMSGDLSFAPGEHDVSRRVSLSEGFIGRAEELLLLERFCENDSGGMFYVSADAGVGKSRLLSELFRRLSSRGIVCLEGRCYDSTRKMPHAPVRDVITDYVHQFHRYPNIKRKTITSVVNKYCGEMGKIVVSFNSGVKPILGDFPDIVPIDPETEIQRFYKVMTRFIYGLSEAEGKLVIIIEDVHWADAGTVEMLASLKKMILSFPLKIIVSFREKELAARADVNETMDQIFTEGCGTDSLLLKPFPENEIGLFVPCMIAQKEERNLLSEYLYRKTKGNPLFTQEIIKLLIEENAFEMAGRSWRVNKQVLDSLSVPETVLDMIVNRTALFSPEERSVYETAAIIGKHFSFDLLLEVDKERHEGASRDSFVADAINQAVTRYILERAGEGDEYYFVHDRIRDAFLVNLNDRQRKKFHAVIAAILEERSAHEGGPAVFEVFEHYREAQIDDKILHYGLRAAASAMEEHAYQDAIAYYESVKAVLDGKDHGSFDETMKSSWLECMQGLGVSCSRAGDAERSVALFKEVLPHIDDSRRKADLYMHLSRACFRIGDLALSEKYVRMGLALLGEKFPVSDRWMMVMTIKELLISRVLDILPKCFFPLMKSRHAGRVKMIIGLYEWLNWVYFFSEGWKMARTVFRMLNLCRLRLGKSHELALTCYYFGFFAVIMGKYKRAERYLNLAYSMMQEYNNSLGIAQCLDGWGIYHIMRGDFPRGIDACKQSVDILEKIGDSIEISKSAQFLFSSHFLMSQYPAAWLLYRKYHGYLRTIFDEMTYSSFVFPVIYYIETGQYRAARDVLDSFISHQYKFKTQFLYYTSLSMYGYCYAEEGDMERSLKNFERAHEVFRNNRFPSHTHIFFQHYAEAMIADCIQRGHALNAEEKRSYHKKIRKACLLGLKHTEKWNHNFDVALRACARYYMLTGNRSRAERFFVRSIAQSKKIRRRFEHAKTLFEYGIFLNEQNRKDEARETFFSSYSLFSELGIDKYKERLAKMLDLGRDEGNRLLRHIREQKHEYVLEKSRDLLSFADLTDILDETLATSMEISGAKRGHLYLYDEERDALVRVAFLSMSGAENDDCVWPIIDTVFQTGEAVINTPGPVKISTSFKGAGDTVPSSILCVPLRYNELVNGVCYLDNPLAGGVFVEDDIFFLNVYLGPAVLAIENKLLHQRLEEYSLSIDDIPASQMGDRYMQDAVAYIQQNYMDQVSRETAAAALDINPDYFGKMFKIHTGKSFKEYLNETRIKMSLDKIAGSEKKIIDIAYESGFESLRTFYRIFYRVMGETPSSYRETHKTKPLSPPA